MKANELRIGNYLERYSKIVKLIEIGIKHKDDTNYYLRCEFDNNGYWIDQFKPIPLTEEMLLKCGFKEYDGGETFDLDIEEELYVTFRSDDMAFFIVITNNGYPTAIKREVKYLHQLQNLYFALTGKELEINL